MKKKRFSAEQIVAILKQAELGIPIAKLVRIEASKGICGWRP
jgi:putative transposase